jgi:ATPase subunit of ABC transporter with duplicated ATPase domains
MNLLNLFAEGDVRVCRSVRLYRYEPVRGYSTSARKPALGSGSSDRIAEAMKRAVKQREVEQKTKQQEAVVGFGDGLDPHQAKLLQEMNELLRQPDTPKNREKAQELLKQAQKFQRDLSKPKRAPPAVKTPAKPDNATHKKKTVNVPLATVTPKVRF